MGKKIPLYAGFAGITLKEPEYDLGNGLMLNQTYAHVMAPFIAAFERPLPGQAHPAPWRSAGGAIFTDIQVQLTIPPEGPQGGYDQMNTAWLISALITLAITPKVTVPILSDLPFSMIRQSENDPVLRPLELTDEPFIPDLAAPTELTSDGLAWVRNNWRAAAELAQTSREFDIALRGFYYSTRASSPSLALLSLWALLEELFSPSRAELRFRVAALIATYLAPPGPSRLEIHKSIMKLYDARSKAAHGIAGDDWNALIGTYTIVRAVLRKMISHQKLPAREDLERELFGAE